jgi:hypothetical protein
LAISDVISWVDVTGTETILTNQPNVHILLPREGLYMPPFSFQEDKAPLSYGSVLRRINVEPREVDLTVLIKGTSAVDLRENIRSFLSLFNPLRGDGKLRVQGPDGEIRELICRYVGGMEGQEGKDNSGETFIIMVVTFRALDPFWVSAQEFTYSFELDQNPPKWFPIFPLRLGGESVVSEITIDNTGDVETFPTWTIRGPGSNPKMTNLSTGKVIEFTGVTLDDTQSITIDTKNRIVQLNDGTSLFPNLTWTSSFWMLQPGQNTVKIEMSGATSASRIDIAYRLRYLGA